MQTLIIGALIALSSHAMAESNVTYYLNSKGAQMDVKVALKASLDGETIVKCSPVVATPNKTGSSISFKAVKVIK